MKTIVSIFLFMLMVLMQSCTTNECPPDPLVESDIAGYIDGSTGVLFTTSVDKDAVLESLNAVPHDDATYRFPVFEIGDQQVYLVFQVAEVEHPSQFVNYHYSDYCYGGLFREYENELMELIELNEENLNYHRS